MTNDDSSSAILGGGAVAISLGVQYFLTFGLKASITQLFGPAVFGLFTTAMLIVAVGRVVGGIGMPTELPRTIASTDDKAERQKVFGASLVVTAAMAVAIPAVIVLLPIGKTSDVQTAAMFAAMAVPGALLLFLGEAALRGTGNVAGRVWLRNIGLRVLFLLGAVTIGIIGISSRLLFVLISLSYTITGIVGASYAIWKIGIATPTIHQLRSLFKRSLPLAATSGIWFLFADIDKFLILKFTSAEAVGIYAVVYTVVQATMLPLIAIEFIGLPLLVDADKSVRKYLYLSFTYGCWFVGGFALLSVLALHEIIFEIGFGLEESPEGILSWLLLAVGIHLLLGANRIGLVASEQRRSLLLVTTTAAIFNIVLNIIFIPLYGLVAAAAATTVSYACLNIFATLVLHSETGIIPFNTNRIVRFLPAIAWYTVVIVVMPPTILGDILATFIGGIGYIGIVYWIGVSEKERCLFWRKLDEISPTWISNYGQVKS